MLSVFLTKTGIGKSEIRKRIANDSAYDLNRTVDEIRPKFLFEISCQGTVPEAIIAFLDSDSYEDAIRKALEIAQRLVDQEPDRADYKVDLAVSLARTGENEAMENALAILKQLKAESRLSPHNEPILCGTN